MWHTFGNQQVLSQGGLRGPDGLLALGMQMTAQLLGADTVYACADDSVHAISVL